MAMVEVVVVVLEVEAMAAAVVVVVHQVLIETGCIVLIVERLVILETHVGI